MGRVFYARVSRNPPLKFYKILKVKEQAVFALCLCACVSLSMTKTPQLKPDGPDTHTNTIIKHCVQ